MLLFLTLVNETQMPQSQNFKTTFKKILACISILSVRVNLKNKFQCETLHVCSMYLLHLPTIPIKVRCRLVTKAQFMSKKNLRHHETEEEIR
jgi:hypothetical protein